MLVSPTGLSESVYRIFQGNEIYFKTFSKLVRNNQQVLQRRAESLRPPKLGNRQTKYGKIVHYEISIFYTRPEFGEKCKFISTYCAKEKSGVRRLKRIFARAFKSAHPTWSMVKITVSPS